MGHVSWSDTVILANLDDFLSGLVSVDNWHLAIRNNQRILAYLLLIDGVPIANFSFLYLMGRFIVGVTAG